MNRSLPWAIGALFLIGGSLAASKALQIGAMVKHGKAFVPPPSTVNSAPVRDERWSQDLNTVGTLTAVQGITIAAELTGKVVQIAFEPGTLARKGDLLIRQDTSYEEAQLPGAVAAAKLAGINRVRAERMLADGIISETDRDSAVATSEQAEATANSIRATIAKKTLRVPFGGQLGTRQVSLGQLLREGDAIVTLQALDPIYVDFNLPQQTMAQVKTGQALQITCDALPGRTLQGRVTAISPLVDSDTRNIKLQATVENHQQTLRPGMFVQVALGQPAQVAVQAIPATAVLYAPYSDSVFVIDPSPDGKGALLRQQLVTLGDKRGDLVAVASGLKAGENVVSTGVFKLRNGMPVVVDNSTAPTFRQAPAPANN